MIGPINLVQTLLSLDKTNRCSFRLPVQQSQFNYASVALLGKTICVGRFARPYLSGPHLRHEFGLAELVRWLKFSESEFMTIQGN